MVDKNEVLDVINDLEESVQNMRENGETDLRSVLFKIDMAYSKINSMKEAIV